MAEWIVLVRGVVLVGCLAPHGSLYSSLTGVLRVLGALLAFCFFAFHLSFPVGLLLAGVLVPFQ